MNVKASDVFGRTSEGEVSCIACGETVARSDAREYDKHGDRWTREDKDFEYLCKPCYREYCHQPRDGLEETLIQANAGTADRASFLRQYHELVSDETSKPRRD